MTRPRPDPGDRSGPESGDLVSRRYRLLERVGVGGMATVYRARDERLERAVALKLIAERLAEDAAYLLRFRQEAELGARLAHPNIVAHLDSGHAPRDFIVMELVDGLDAGKLLHRRGRLTPRATVRAVAQLCEALACAHGQGVVHRDVSPQNILIRRCDGTAKLADFGLASHAGEGPATQAANIAGTPGYVAPEVLWGFPATPRSDLYSLGLVTYRFLAGRSPLRPGDADATAPLATAAGRLPSLADVRPDLPRGLVAAVQRAMADAPDSRQESVTEFRVQLIRGHGAPTGSRRSDTVLPPAISAKARRRERRLAAASPLGATA